MECGARALLLALRHLPGPCNVGSYRVMGYLGDLGFRV